MIEEGTLLYFNPFEFKNGATPKAKYFIVLANSDEGFMVASLPTSKDFIPSDIQVEQGGVNVPERDVNAYIFEAGVMVTDTFAFPRRTFVYGEQVDAYTEEDLAPMNGNVTNLGLIKPELFTDLKSNLKKATHIKRKYAKLL